MTNRAPRGSRPPHPGRTSSGDTTRYGEMLIAATDEIPSTYHILAKLFTWMLLAGFVIVPGTFASLQAKPAPDSSSNELGGVEVVAIDAIKQLPLFVVAWVCTGLGAIGMVWLWYRWRLNHIWIVDNIFMPGFINSLTGMLPTLSSVISTHDTTFSSSIFSNSTIVAIASVAGVCGVLTVFYKLVWIRPLKKEHKRTVGKYKPDRGVRNKDGENKV
ncbi:hypothetical protein DFH07DRAFT_918984 [Mycena maculata]|uniref:Uncharacterized protein n=1 Tax=Mycena maculata TaxID=230809 RepID=A0AAD7NG54_9AGAR|nr:hypothetical protein DFH07DRAFT_918984 [Mycena maculata]